MIDIAMFKLSVTAVILVYLCGNIQSETVTLHTRLGTIVGKRVQTSFLGQVSTVSTFRGIPYAEPPTGDRRFRKALPKGTLQSPFNATAFGPGCPQDLFMMMGWVPGYPYLDEDCLTLNVFVPENNTKQPNDKYAVMVWIYGGAYVIGQSKMYSAENLTMVGDVIVVTVNYRISALGFLSTGSNKYPGNSGLWDQQMALRWVHDNIADFGGDPSRVTIFGESAGGSSVLYQALYPQNRGLFQRVIAESGSPLCPWAFQPEPAKYARKLANNLGCTNSNLDAAVDCLQKLDYMTIANNSRGVGTQDETVFRAEWDPSLDWEIITRLQPEMFTQNVDMFKDLDVIVGMNNNDGAFVTLLAIQPYMQAQLNKTFDAGIPREFFKNFYVPMYLRDMYGNTSTIMEDWIMQVYTDWRDLDNDDFMRKKFLEFSGDYNFFMPLMATLKAHAQEPRRGKSFLYEFRLRPSFNRSPMWVEGANHGEELPFVFGFPALMADGMHYYDHVPDREKRISKNMMIMWSNFAKSGDPNLPVLVPDSIAWPEYTTSDKRFLQISENATAPSSNLFGERTAFWLELEPQLRKVTALPPPIIG